MARCVIVSACPVSPALAGLLRAEDYLIACDAGYCNCKALGRQPDAVVGDFDSAPRPDMPEGEERTQLVMLLAHHMKKMMLAVNKDGVDDDKIFKDLAYYSKGKILLDSSTCQLRDFKELTQQPAANAKKSKKRK